MPIPMTAAELLDREFLHLRAGLIDLGAALDRIDRAEGSLSDDPRLQQIGRAIQILTADASDRAERLQSLFSLPYQDNWRNDYAL